MSRPKTSHYTVLGDGSMSQAWQSRSKCQRWLRHAVGAALIFLAMGVSFVAGRYYLPADLESNIPLTVVDRAFIYNRTFAEGTKNAEKAWMSLFPPENGFFSHPSVAPRRSTLSVYHELHCLNGIREGYWKVHEFAVTGTKLNESDLPMMISPPHIRHCIDLLRQSLMCNPDTTVEEKNEELGGVHGFGVQHRCKNWNDLLDWTIEAQKLARN